MPKQNLPKGTNPNQNSHHISIKTRKAKHSQHAAMKVAPDVPRGQKKATRELTSTEQKILDWEVQEYFSEKNSGVRRYPRDKTFTWHDDLWPHFR